ncbi:translocon-associated protein subunit delta-like [Daphnia pulex]|uniref:translocon-associated protein subunit delta-like n=1 Tax=Daphnia pulex TaxID=6669 RepID=UPI001EDDE89E|nr:translocon-associated protein subunit delta-like [Daphnia pulex]XP_046638529.1 translocon-associated protein subunit delta-like [Daphnia pulicaria]
MSCKLLVVFSIAVCFSAVSASSCSSPSLTSTSFTTLDGTILTNIAYVSQFKLSCDGEPADIPLYAEVGGKPLSVVKSKETNEYVVSWLEETKKAPRGNFEIKVYDDEGYAAVRKAQRNGEDTSAVPTVGVVVLYHPGAYTGPWINSELAAVIVAFGVLYYAVTTKTKLEA